MPKETSGRHDCRISPKREAIYLRRRARLKLRRAGALEAYERELERAKSEFERAMRRLLSPAQRKRYEAMRADLRRYMNIARRRSPGVRYNDALAKARQEGQGRLVEFLRTEEINAVALRNIYRARFRKAASAMERLERSQSL